MQYQFLDIVILSGKQFFSRLFTLAETLFIFNSVRYTTQHR